MTMKIENSKKQKTMKMQAINAEQSEIIELNGRRYRTIQAKTNDKICKECDYFLDNGVCNLNECPCADINTILQRV